jgi:hypothetical protein
MTEAKVTKLEAPRLELVQELLRSNGIRISILLPPYRPGEQGKSMAALLKTDIQNVLQQFTARRIPEPVTLELLKPLQQLTEDEEFSEGSRFGRALFRSRDVFQQFDLPGVVKPLCVVASYFQIRPILGDLQLPPEFYLLKLSQKNVELKRCADFHLETVKLPKGVPETLDEAMAFKQPDHDLENRSAAGASTGAMRRIRFGTGSGRETQHTYIADFYKMVDRGIAELLHTSEPPLILAGVDEDTAAYRTTHTYPNLLSQSIHGNLKGSVSEQELLLQAHSIVRAEHLDRAAASLVESREHLAPARFTTDLATILRAAAEGRVDKLFIDESAQKIGRSPDANHGGRSNQEEDLLNVAAVETILHGGMAFALPANKVPEGAAVAAVFRY